MNLSRSHTLGWESQTRAQLCVPHPTASGPREAPYLTVYLGQKGSLEEPVWGPEDRTTGNPKARRGGLT